MRQKLLFFENEPENLLKTKDRPKNKPEKRQNKPKTKLPILLKTIDCGKNKPENKAGHVAENKGSLKNEPKSIQSSSSLSKPLLHRFQEAIYDLRS